MSTKLLGSKFFGSTGEQNVYLSTIEHLPEVPKENNVKPPSMIIIGEVVSLHEKLAWYQPNNKSI